ncbi:MFS transporter [Teichococcus aestuarii]|uniref:MFS transporter n=1 Tax=Teichococcus aestuarii TaxID=568898 RepID=UPI00361AFECA
MSSFASLVVPLLGPPLMARAGLPPESIGLVSAMTSVGICWSLACGGPMLGHHGPVRTLQIGLACMVAGLFVLSQPLGLLGLLGALAIGFGLGPNTPAGSQILMRTAPPRHRTLIFSIKQAGVPLGGALAGLVVAPLVLRYGLPATLGVVIGVILLTLLVVQPFRRRLDEPRGAGHPGWARALVSPAGMLGSIGVLRAHSSLPMLTALGASFSMTQSCLTAFTATYAVTRHGASLAEAGLIVALMQGASMVGRIVMGWVADRMGQAMRLLVLQAGASALAVGLLVVAGGQGAWALYGCAALAGLTAIGWNGVHIAELARVAPLHQVSDVTSAASLFGFIGSIFGPLLFTLLVSWSGSYGRRSSSWRSSSRASGSLAPPSSGGVRAGMAQAGGRTTRPAEGPRVSLSPGPPRGATAAPAGR